jgi:ABC-type glycerol-3-phosphate transport system permease component
MYSSSEAPQARLAPAAVEAPRFRLPWLTLIQHLILIVGSLCMAFPFLWMLVSSFKSPDEIFTGHLFELPKVWKFSNYTAAWKSAPFGHFFLNSLVMSGSSIVGQVMTCCMAAYAFACVRFPGKQIVFVLFIASTMIPFEATMIPTYLIMKNLKLINTYPAMFLPSLTSVFGIFLLRQFYMTIPRDLLEAARIDGCSHIGILWRIVMPLSRTVLATLALFTFIHSWNSYLWPFLVTNSSDMRTVQVGLRYMINKEVGTEWPELLAASIIILLPTIAVFLFLQKYFVRSLVQSGLK